MSHRCETKVVVPSVTGRGLSQLVLMLTMVLFLTVIPGATVAAEEKGDGRRAGQAWLTEAGFITGYGNANLDEGVYRTLLMVGHFAKDINHFIPALQEHRGRLSFFLEPQFNYVLKPAGEIELGLGIGFQYSYPVSARISPYILVVTGPQLISVDSITQANGLNFSSAVGVGIYFSLTKNIALNLGYRHRHVSNAELNKPNEGIDSEIGILGLSYFF
jgi:lipid A 3-O-deacylase